MAYCSNCGTEMSDLATACPSCGQPTARARPSAAVPNYLVQAILVTIFCCLPLGIVSIVYSTQVNSKLAAGDFEGAVAASDNARKWAWIAVVGGIVSIGVFNLLNIGPDFGFRR